MRKPIYVTALRIEKFVNESDSLTNDNDVLHHERHVIMFVNDTIPYSLILYKPNHDNVGNNISCKLIKNTLNNIATHGFIDPHWKTRNSNIAANHVDFISQHGEITELTESTFNEISHFKMIQKSTGDVLIDIDINGNYYINMDYFPVNNNLPDFHPVSLDGWTF